MNSPANPGRGAPDRPSVRRSGVLVVVLVSAVLAGCASFSPDAGFSSIESAAKDKLGKDVRWARSDADVDTIDRRVRELLAKPLSVDDAVQVALLNNRGLQARFQDLGITEAEVVQAGRLPNPGFTFGRLRQGDEVELERGLHLNLARLLTLPMVSQLEARRFEQVKREVTMDVLSLAADARKAYFQAVAAEETVRYMRQVKQTAEASAELARRMEQVGNFCKLASAREQAFYADAALGFARADQAQRASRERLARLLGVWGDQLQFQLPERLPDLPAEARNQPDIEAVAMAQRLDVQAAKLGAEQTAKNLGLTRTTRFINVLELGLVRNTSNEAPRQTGWEIGLELPLFDWGGARVARAEAIYMQARSLRQLPLRLRHRAPSA
jgi:outer membrane protein TolC